MNVISINTVEVASDMAHQRLTENVSDEQELFTTDEDGNECYKEEYQDQFNNLYDDYYNFIIDRRLNQGVWNAALETAAANVESKKDKKEILKLKR